MLKNLTRAPFHGTCLSQWLLTSCQQPAPFSGDNSMLTKHLFSLIPPSPPKHGEKERRILRRKAVGHASTGNVLLQSGRYATKEDCAARKKKALSRS